MKYDVYIRTACSVYDVEAKTDKSAKIKALELMLKELREGFFLARKRMPELPQQLEVRRRERIARRRHNALQRSSFLRDGPQLCVDQGARRVSG